MNVSRPELPTTDASHREWQQAAQRWAELVVLRWEWDESLDASDRDTWNVLRRRSRIRSAWMIHRYGSLHNLPYHQQPVMVHQIPRFMAVERTRKKLAKIALLVLDGLAFDQWLLLRKNLEASDTKWRFQESTAFAWVPTLTSVTRQSIFAGEPPLYFPDSLATTSKEKAHWLRFWEDQGLQRAGVDLVTSLDGPTTRSWRRPWAIPGCRSWESSGTRSMTSCTGCRCRPQGCTTKCGCGPRRAICNELLDRLAKETSPST